MTDHEALPVAVIGAGPVGLAAAAHLIERGLDPLVLEAGATVGAAMLEWGHVQLFSTWRYNLDPASARLLKKHGWEAPHPSGLPTGTHVVRDYLGPLAATPELADRVRVRTRVTAVTRQGLDKGRSSGREQTPFLLRTIEADGRPGEILARAVVDASGTWSTRAPLGAGGLPAHGEDEAFAAGLVTGPLPDVRRNGFAGKRTLVVGAGHSAANTVLALVELGRTHPGTAVVWAIRAGSPTRAYGGEDADQLPARGQLGARLHRLVEAGRVELVTGFSIHRLEVADRGLRVQAADGRAIEVDRLVPATGFRPDLSILSELRLDLDPAVDAPRRLGPLIDPDFHSCGTVPPHGAPFLAHPDKDFYIVGMKSYGRAPTFLMATGYEQVRSVAAALAGDTDAANAVALELPDTGVCSTDAAGGEDSCCGGTPEPVSIGFPSGLLHGRSAEPASRRRS